MSVRSRITGETRRVPPSTGLSGEWELVVAEQVNGATGAPGDVLLASTDELLRFGRTALLDWRSQALELNESRRLEGLFRVIEALHDKPAREWLAVSPIAPELEAEVRPGPFEQAMEKHLDRGPVEVCREPRSQLVVAEELLAAHQARRPSAKAPAILAKRPEDWYHPTATGVQPKRITGRVRREIHDLYENRVTVSLLNLIELELRWRIRRLEQLQRDMAVLEGEGYQDAAVGTRFKQRRLFKLWGERFTSSPQEIKNAVEQLHAQLEEWHRTVERCKKRSVLYRTLRQLPVPQQLRVTNIFESDAKYRHVGQLWRSLKLPAGRLEPQAYHRRQQQAARAWNGYGLLLTLRALGQMGYVAADTHTPALSDTITLTHTRLTTEGLAVTCADDGSHRLERDGVLLARVVPILADHEQALAAAYRHALPSGSLILSLGRPTGAESVGREMIFVPVDPDDIESTERVGKALRPYVLGTRLLAYPVAAPRMRETPTRYARDASGGWALIRPVPRDEAASFGLEQAEEKEVHALELLKAELSSAKQEHFKNLENRVRDREARLESIRTKRDAWGRGVGRINDLATCPACGTRDAAFDVYQGDQYKALCSSCEAEWGARTCRSCNEAYAVFLPARPSLAMVRVEGEKEDYFGMDILARPKVGAPGSFICPHCGEGT